jgi:hypothetical protein
MIKSGIVRESNASYHGYKDAISKSRLSKMALTPRYFKWCEDNPQEPTEDLIFGSAFHKAVLEPRTFGKEFVVMPYIDRRTKAGKELYAEFESKANNRDIITQENYDIICGMRERVMENKYARALLSNGFVENSMYYTDDLTGIECKIRPDVYKIVGDKVIITDLKSCKSASPEDFTRDIVKYGYDLQCAMYKTGVSKVLHVPIENIEFVFVAVEKKAPYLMGIYEADNNIFERGESLYRKYLGMLKQCRETNDWYDYNGFSHEPSVIGLPDYMLKK